MAEASAKRVTGAGDEPQGTMGRVQTAGQILCRLIEKKSFSWCSGSSAGVGEIRETKKN